MVRSSVTPSGIQKKWFSCILTGWVQYNVNNYYRSFTCDTKMRGQTSTQFRIFFIWYSKPWHVLQVFIEALLCTVWTHKDDFKRLALVFYFVVGLFQLRHKGSARWALQIIKKKHEVPHTVLHVKTTESVLCVCVNINN